MSYLDMAIEMYGAALMNRNFVQLSGFLLWKSVDLAFKYIMEKEYIICPDDFSIREMKTMFPQRVRRIIYIPDEDIEILSIWSNLSDKEFPGISERQSMLVKELIRVLKVMYK